MFGALPERFNSTKKYCIGLFLERAWAWAAVLAITKSPTKSQRHRRTLLMCVRIHPHLALLVRVMFRFPNDEDGGAGWASSWKRSWGSRSTYAARHCVRMHASNLIYINLGRLKSDE